MPYRMMKYGNPISQSSRFSILKYLPFCLRPRSGFRSGQRIALVYSWYQKNKSEAIHTIFRRHFLLLVNNAMAIDIWHRLVQKTLNPCRTGTRLKISVRLRDSHYNLVIKMHFPRNFLNFENQIMLLQGKMWTQKVTKEAQFKDICTIFIMDWKFPTCFLWRKAREISIYYKNHGDLNHSKCVSKM